MIRMLAIFLQIIFILTLSILLERWVMIGGPMKWILHTETGMNAYVWLLTLFNLEGLEDGEDMLILLTLSVTLIASTLTCVALTKALRKLRRSRVDPNVE
ncbi:hypothetical protein OKW98_24770 [Pseudomonas sp. KU26590]|uniref:hypothetical protein n=1 Tax=Pseudomonas sp. KU26590 TaxID=2991051 RepID=UPI00223D63B0|nr:hypothetical protein [Pseudomonas sp. KU26590]UZJ59718.1 hypothetical protein OKW98_24770 [Pseudomonas sp. KU26590]